MRIISKCSEENTSKAIKSFADIVVHFGKTVSSLNAFVFVKEMSDWKHLGFLKLKP